MARKKTLQKLIELYRIHSGETELEMTKVMEFAKDQGISLPQPKTPEELLVKELTVAAREDIRTDEKTGRPYREYHALPIKQGNQTSFVYVSVQDATRPQMHRSLQKRREQIVDDAVKLANDAEHWNNINAHAEPIQLEFDFTFDVELRRMAEDETPA